MSAYEVLPEFVQDSDEWHAARLNSLGASEVAAVLGLSKWQTPLSVYNAKKGVPIVIDEDLAYFGHALEPVISGWVSKKHPEVGLLSDGFSARSTKYPWLTASPDRVAYFPLDSDQPPFDYVPVELKTSSAYSKSEWENGVPLYYQAQVQVQIAVLDAPYGWLAVLHGGNSPELFKVPRDDEFIETMVRVTKDFWENNVLANVAPDPTTSAEAVEVWPGNPDLVIEGGEDLYELWGSYGLMQAEQVELDNQIAAVKLELQKAMQDAVELTYQGKTLFTWKPRKGSARLDAAELKKDHPDVAAMYTKPGEPTRTFIRKTVKEVDA